MGRWRMKSRRPPEDPDQIGEKEQRMKEKAS